MEAFRTVDDRFGNKMVGNYRPPCPLHSRTVSATFKWKNDKTAYIIVRMTACVLIHSNTFALLLYLFFNKLKEPPGKIKIPLNVVDFICCLLKGMH